MSVLSECIPLAECYTNGVERLVVPKTCSSREGSFLGLAMYAWAGYVLECAACGVIYRSRQFWYGNQDPINTVVRTEIRHVWPGRNPVLQGTHNAARRLVDGIQYVSDAIAYVGAKPTKVMTNWVTDQIAPAYWVPNAQITHCYHCRHEFDHSAAMHHCRACGQGFCEDCSLNKKPVPERGWGEEPVRVCDSCFHGDSEGNQDDLIHDPQDDLYPRKVGEALSFSIGAVANLMQYPLDVIRDTVRPAYWVPDAEISECCVCAAEFGPRLAIHHCRACGLGVCDPCSSARRPVPSRGWDQTVRVCDACNKKKGAL
ncbi:hypothetical protein CAPTEDRAFT_1802 [Capitella teleta]|uniref:FYVE-type domain-containing protein n=1 Tax=Capitella teleta TaxID=283909 RepID=R7TSE7_CAPTE|nr:hypothetical protein CAPTEDRAFT_1802 [Capitella teleta]|eukprot:ELT96584.1 hypothetical protein CAPTEDRAFT_1802 [Capitella teleta]